MLSSLMGLAIVAGLYATRRFYWSAQVLRAGSRMLNALAGGEGDCTLSAWSWHMTLQEGWGRVVGIVRVRVIDALMGEGHCERAYDWHLERRLLDRDHEDV